MLFPPLAKRFLFSAVRMPAVVKPVVENDDGPVLEQRRDEVEDRFRGFVEVAVDVDDSGSCRSSACRRDGVKTSS
jgi:hypothetical protein